MEEGSYCQTLNPRLAHKSCQTYCIYIHYIAAAVTEPSNSPRPVIMAWKCAVQTELFMIAFQSRNVFFLYLENGSLTKLLNSI